jgi:hypothetical protein
MDVKQPETLAEERKLIHNDTFETRLGSIECSLSTLSTGTFPVRTKNSDKGSRTVITTAGHFIEMYSFPLQTDWLAEADMSVESSKGWVWRITKINDLKESLKLKTCLLNPQEGVACTTQSGEFLDALCIENPTEQISIGTEDNEVLRLRARENDWMPSRPYCVFGSQVKISLQITSTLVLKPPFLNCLKTNEFIFIS